MSIFVCLTSDEWRNLCSVGRIRIQKSRAVNDSEQQYIFNRHAVFELTPDAFAVGESSHLIIGEIDDRWAVSDHHDGDWSSNQSNWLNLEEVVSFFPVQSKDAWIFESDAEQASIRLSPAKFQGLWDAWTKTELVRAANMNGRVLVEICDFVTDGEHGPENLTWAEIAALAIEPTIADAASSNLTLRLLQLRETVFETCREDTDSGAFYVSCLVIWANKFSEVDILELDPAFASRCQELHQKLRATSFDFSHLDDPDVVSFLVDLRERVPTAFSDDWKPITISLYVRCFHRLKFGKPTQDEILATINISTQFDGANVGGNLAFLLGVGLGANRVHQLARRLRPMRFTVVIPPQPMKEPSESVAKDEIKDDTLGLGNVIIVEPRAATVKDSEDMVD